MSSASNFHLLEQARQGDAESLGLLLRSYFRYLNALSLGHLDERIRVRVSASDIVQETLLEAHQDFKSFVGTSLQEFTGWLRKILFNNLARAIEQHLLAAKRDVRRQRSIHRNLQDSSDASPSGIGLPAGLPSVSSMVCHDETLGELKAAIALLPKDYQRVIQMRHIEGFSFPDIAAKLGRKPGTTRMLWLRAIVLLKEIMSKNESSN